MRLRAGRVAEARDILAAAISFVRENWAADAAVSQLADIALAELAIALGQPDQLSESAARLREYALASVASPTDLSIRAQYVLGRIEQERSDWASAEYEYAAALGHAGELWPESHWFAEESSRSLEQLRAQSGGAEPRR